MERKIGEIFKYNGEWYQCVGGTCRNCISYYDTVCKNITTIGSTNFGNCHCSLRTDHKSVIFKKLEKVGEPFTIVGKLYQHYKVFDIDNVCGDGFWCVHNYKAKTLTIEIKQNKEDMEEKKSMTEKFKEYISRVSEEQLEKDLELLKKFNESGVPVDEFIKSQETAQMKSFNLEAAKAGKPVCTRDGRKARIICFDRKFYHDGYNYPIVAMVNYYDNDNELVHAFTQDGLLVGNAECELDLMMLPEKKEGWVNVFKRYDGSYHAGEIYNSDDSAARMASEKNYITTIKIFWEE